MNIMNPDGRSGGAAENLVKSLSAKATEFNPLATTPVAAKRSASPVKPIKTRDVYETLDYVPFTPSQGICTPSPSNLAALWMAQRSHSDMSRAMSDNSSLSSSDYYFPVYYPIAFSPMHHGAVHSAPVTPLHHKQWANDVAPIGPSFMPHSPHRSPVAAPAPIMSPGKAIFAQYLTQEGYGSGPSSPSDGTTRDSSPAKRSLMGGDSAKSEGTAAATDAGYAEAAAWCADQGYYGEPPQAVLELASLANTHGMGINAAIEAAGGSQPSSSPSKAGPDGGKQGAVNKLNARQRRTLRRAQERALGALKAFTVQEEERTPQKTQPPSQLPMEIFAGLAPGEVAPMVFGSPAPLWHAPMPMMGPFADCALLHAQLPYALPMVMSPQGLGPVASISNHHPLYQQQGPNQHGPPAIYHTPGGRARLSRFAPSRRGGM